MPKNKKPTSGVGEMKTQREFIEIIDALIDANPKSVVRLMIASDEVSEDHKHTAHLIQRVEVEVYYEGVDGYYIGDSEVNDYLTNHYISQNIAETEAEQRAKKEMKDFELGIFVYTGAT